MFTSHRFLIRFVFVAADSEDLRTLFGGTFVEPADKRGSDPNSWRSSGQRCSRLDQRWTGGLKTQADLPASISRSSNQHVEHAKKKTC